MVPRFSILQPLKLGYPLGSADPATGLVATRFGFLMRDPFYTGGSIAGMTNFTTAAQMNLMNQLPSGRIDANALKLLQLYPAQPALRSQGFTNPEYFVQTTISRTAASLITTITSTFARMQTSASAISYLGA